MGWSVVEQFVEGKSSHARCEDLIVVSEHFFAVIDGATDETGADFDGMSGGRFAATVLAAEIVGLPSSIGARQWADRLSEALRSAVESNSGPLADDVRWPVASIVCFVPSQAAIWRVGDCSYALDGDVHLGEKAVDDASYGFRAVINAALLASGVTIDEVIHADPGAAASRPLYDLQQHLANTTGPWGYGCINGRPVPDEHIEVLPVDNHINEIVLASDGFPDIAMNLADTERLLAEQMAADPAAVDSLWRMGKPARPGFNAPDDRAYLRLTRAG